MRSNIFIARAALVLAFSSSGWSLASEAASDDVPQAAQSGTDVSVMQVQTEPAVLVEVEPPVPVAAKPVVVSGLGVPLMSDQLDDYRGGFDVVKNDAQLSGSVADNSARNFTTGNNSIADGAFSSASGLPMVIQNSGSNVLIQNATIINLQVK